ncbi:aldehyde dehydrogenase [Actinoallomurus sp. NPDC050550]|uniref:aldehyde dehydrogenase n=1 Tax=Actinoallomurus sp. NPDC050550 TaxID=3154937 RepID=UPI0033FEC5FA
MRLRYDSLFIDGQWAEPHGTGRIVVRSPNTEDEIGDVPEAVEADVDDAVAAARRAFEDPSGWAAWPPEARAGAMERLADALDARAEDMASRVSGQNGMPIAIARQIEAGMPALVLRYYADLIRRTPAQETRPGLLGGSALVRREPIGVVAAIVPWNYPQTLASFKIAPALAAGCTMVIKPSPETVLDAYLLAQAVIDAQLPPGVVNIVTGGRELGAHLVAHPGVDKVAFTGSTAAGRSIAETCGRLLRPVTLELGGKSAAIVLDDADLDGHLQDLFGACLLNNGQTCYLGTRVLAPRIRYDRIVDTVTELARALRVGDSLDPETQIGPLVSARQRDRVESYIAKGRSDGARLTAGGGRPTGRDRGWFVEPTVFADVDNRATIAQEEIFGPVLTITPYTDVDEAVAIANDSDYGLGGSVWTSDPDRGVAVAARVRTGTIGVNGYLPEPVAPFGGVKDSGIGRELGPEGLTAYQQFKSVYLAG